MNSLNDEIIDAYKAACRCFQLQGSLVLQDFARALSVPNYLAASSGTAGHYASQVFSEFIKSYSPVFPLDPLKRMQGIRHLRDFIRVNKSFRSDEQKDEAYEQICNHWFNANDIQGEGEKLWLHDTLSVTLPRGLLLLCDMFRCRPKDLLYYFMEEVVLQMGPFNTDGQAIQFLLHSVTLLYLIKNN